MPVAPTILWFRDDLRLTDNAALAAAAKRDAPLVCLYVFDEDSTRAPGGAARWWLAQSLRALDAQLHKLGQRLVLRRGPALRIISAIAKDSGASHVYWNRRYEQSGAKADDAVIASLKALGVSGGTFAGNVLAEPQTISSSSGGPMRVFTPFWKKLRAMGDPRGPVAAPKSLPAATALASDRLEDWKLEPAKPDWAGGLRETWTPGAAAAHDRLHDFLDTVSGYADARDLPSKSTTSRLSPHLRFGEISAVEVFHAACFAADSGASPRDIEKFLSELGWREFSWHLLHHFPSLAKNNLQERFDAFPWRSDDKALRAWQRGQTGYPIVDAGMRELWQTGWMHNRVRMVVASFLVKHLLIDWREGERWFWDTLVDADPANNPASWQWVAGSGADAAPYFRIFNPVLQGEKFDAAGEYARRWVPEIAKLPDRFIHRPWDASPLELADAEIKLGTTYPHPIVDHAAARKRALAAFAKTKD
jgi:deoxyribodipyrimidine photo-lyase